MTLAPLSQIVIGLAFASVMMALLWFVQRRTKNAGVVDVGWAAGIGIIGVFFAVTSAGLASRRIIVGILIGVWACRLVVHLLVDRIVGQPEEGRYRTLRANWGAKADRNLFFFFQIQAVLSLLFAIPALVVAHNPGEQLTVGDFMGIALWIVAVGCTSLADRQLWRFKQRPDSRGKVCKEGLWRYSRHPNYFFEWLHWWAYAAMSIGSFYWWIPVAAPLIMLFFLLKVTGIPPTEAQAVASRGDAYREYQRTTSAFVPWFPKKDSGGDA